MNNTKIAEKLQQEKGKLMRISFGRFYKVTLVINQTRSQNKEKFKMKQSTKKNIQNLRGDDLRNLYFEVKRYLEVINEEKDQIKGTRLENEFQLDSQIEDLEGLIKEIQQGKLMRGSCK
jgi:hypothetical protein